MTKRTLTEGTWGTGWPSIDVEPHDSGYFVRALEAIAREFCIAMPDYEEPEEERRGWSADFVLDGVPAGAYLNGQRCSFAAMREDVRDRMRAILRTLDD